MPKHADAGVEVVTDQRFEPAFEKLQRRGFTERLERRPDFQRLIRLRHGEVEQTELKPREVQ